MKQELANYLNSETEKLKAAQRKEVFIMNITTEEVNKLASTKSASEWNAVCDQIKRARGGEYPPDWWNKIMMTGMAAIVQRNWK